MKRHHRTFAVIAATLFLAARVDVATASQAGKNKPLPPPSHSVTEDATPGTKVVQVGERDVVKVKAKVRYTTLIVLPKDEEILDFTTGDKEFWIISGNQNFAYVKPAKTGSQTNLNLVTASGAIYSFVLTEVSDVPQAEPDLKVFVQAKDTSIASASHEAPRFVPISQIDACRADLERSKDETRQAKDATQTAIEASLTRFVTNVRFAYSFAAGKKPFYVRAMYHDDKFTYIQARPEETPTLYEIKDGKPNLVNFQYKDGVFIADRTLGDGYLAIGKQRLAFTREE
jgi:type IV secretory pathway VirB9-like protein